MSYMESLGEISSSAKSAHHAANIVKAMTPPDQAIEGAAAASPETKPSVSKSMLGLAPGLAGGGAGALAWKKHRVLGFLGGHALGSNVYPIFRGSAQERKSALCRLGIEGSGVAGALMLKKKMHPVLGWLVGIVAGTAVTAFVPNSPVKAELKKMMEMVK